MDDEEASFRHTALSQNDKFLYIGDRARINQPNAADFQCGGF